MIKNVTVMMLKKKYESNENFVLLDVRTDLEISKTKIPIDSIHIPMNEIPDKISQLNTNDEIIVYCKSGVRSKKVCEFLSINNFKNISNLEGGIVAWGQEIDPKILINLL